MSTPTPPTDRQFGTCGAGLLIAAGRGRRLGGGKQLLTWGQGASETTLVASAFDSIAGVCRRMVVVLGANAVDVSAALTPRRFFSVRSDPDAEMIVSIRAGLMAVLQMGGPCDVLMQLADHPEVSADTLRHMLADAPRDPERAVIPNYQGRGGHPIWIPAGLIARLLKVELPGGLRAIWHAHPEWCRRLPVDDPGVVRDIDVPRDLGSRRLAEE